MEQIVANNRNAESILAELKVQLDVVRAKTIANRKLQLRAENDLLRKQVDAARQQLIQLETQHGKKQYAVPNNSKVLATSTPTPTIAPVKPTKTADAATAPKAAKEKKPKEKKAEAATAPAPVDEGPVDISRIDLRIGKIVDVQKHPDADSLYVEKIDLGESAPRTVVSGLVKFVPIEEMQNRIVVVMCNLKPAKMRGITSEGMVMCASTPEKVEVLSAPANCVPGDLVHCEGYARTPDAQLNPKKKIFETVAPDLRTNDELIACYKGAALHVPNKGTIKAQTLKNVNVK